jgi:hypothetical protein
MRPIILILSISTLLLIISCAEKAEPQVNSNTSSPAAINNSAKTNSEELSLILRMPFGTDDIDDIVWKQDPATKKITAVFRLSKDAATKLDIETLSKYPVQSVSISTESWFPEELSAQGEMSGDAELKGRSYPATDFLMEPFNGGRAIRVDASEYLVLELTAK